MARLAADAGAVIVEDCAVRTIETAAGRVSGVVTEKGTIRAPLVLLAGGAAQAGLLRLLHARPATYAALGLLLAGGLFAMLFAAPAWLLDGGLRTALRGWRTRGQG